MLDITAPAPAGHYLALHVAYHDPTTKVNAPPGAYVEAWRAAGLLPFDPAFRWVHAEVGATRWSALRDDPRGVLALAALHGVRFGLAVLLRDASGLRGWGALARTERKFDGDEAAALEAHARGPWPTARPST